MSRGIEVRGSDRTRGVPRTLGWGKRRKLQFDEGLPGADIKNTGDLPRLVGPHRDDGRAREPVADRMSRYLPPQFLPNLHTALERIVDSTAIARADPSDAAPRQKSSA